MEEIIPRRNSKSSIKKLGFCTSWQFHILHSRMEFLKGTIVEMSRCMLFEKKLSRFLWVEAVNTLVYLLNRLPTKSVQSKTPLEAWSGVRPTAKHLKMFESLCYFHVPTVKRGKLDETTEKRILVGYGTKYKGYRIYNLNGAKIKISKDVHFDEHSCWNWDLKEVDQKAIVALKSIAGRTSDED